MLLLIVLYKICYLSYKLSKSSLWWLTRPFGYALHRYSNSCWGNIIFHVNKFLFNQGKVTRVLALYEHDRRKIGYTISKLFCSDWVCYASQHSSVLNKSQILGKKKLQPLNFASLELIWNWILLTFADMQYLLIINMFILINIYAYTPFAAFPCTSGWRLASLRSTILLL